MLAWLAAASSLNKQARPCIRQVAVPWLHVSGGVAVALALYVEEIPMLCQLHLLALWTTPSLTLSHMSTLIMRAAMGVP